MVLMSSKVVQEEWVRNAVHGLGRENDLGDDGGEENHGQHDVHDVHGEVQVSVHGVEKVRKSFVRRPGMNECCEIVVWSVK